MARYAAPGERGSVVSYRSRYDHFIGGEYVPPAKGRYFADPTPVTGEPFTELARGTAEDVDRALDAAHGAARAWGRTSAAERANVLHEVADRVEDHLDALAVAETWDTGRPVGETLAVDLPSAVEHLRYCAGLVRVREGGITPVGDDVVAYRYPEPLGVVGRLVAPDFPLLTAVRELAPALAAGNAVVLKPAEQTPASIHVLVGLIADLLPPGVVNVVNGFDIGAGRALAASRRVAAMPFGSGADDGGSCPNIFFADVAARRDAFHDRALTGFAAFARDRGEPFRALVQSTVHDEFLADAVERTKALAMGHPLDTATVIGAQTTRDRLDRIMSAIVAARADGARVLCGGERADLGGELSGGYYVTPTVFAGDVRGRAHRDEPVGPVVSVTAFDDVDDAVKIANETARGAGAGVWSRDTGVACRVGRQLHARRVWVNNAPRLLGGETCRVTLDPYQRTRTLLVRDRV
ncbi:aldehyde dehydrogenase family protein [Saccharothrix hoggarensis]|uniref:Aldehyde dehydrogenase family protein n=1 Tax=Saccharothrix hoggarensis TaxID=913853 RepID=A0ABW3QWB5_9PSEU